MTSDGTESGDESDTAADFRRPREPTIDDGTGTITLWGVGPTCPGCDGPTHAVTGDEAAERPWWCGECNVRLDDTGEPGSQGRFPDGREASPAAADNGGPR